MTIRNGCLKQKYYHQRRSPLGEFRADAGSFAYNFID